MPGFNNRGQTNKIRIKRHEEQECWDAYNEKVNDPRYVGVCEPVYIGYEGSTFAKAHWYCEVKRIEFN